MPSWLFNGNMFYLFILFFKRSTLIWLLILKMLGCCLLAKMRQIGVWRSDFFWVDSSLFNLLETLDRINAFYGFSPFCLFIFQILELPDHPYYIGVQFHPEFKSRPGKASPLFLGIYPTYLLSHKIFPSKYTTISLVVLMVKYISALLEYVPDMVVNKISEKKFLFSMQGASFLCVCVSF